VKGKSNISIKSCAGVYGYGFNGQERDNEWKGDGNSYTTYWRQYDPRLGRWLSIDPLTSNFSWQSPYVGMDNSPIYLSDPNGDSTSFYDSGGKLLYTSYDNLENAVTVIPKEGIEGFRLLVQRMESGKLNINDEHIQALRDHGKSYSIDDLREFYKKNSTDIVNGYVNEHKTFLVDDNGMVRINYEDYVGDHSMNTDVSEDPNAVGKVHTHPNAGKPANYPYIYGHKPSRPDYTSSYKGTSYFDIVISDKYIFFINHGTYDSPYFSADFAVFLFNTFEKGKVTTPWNDL
jgi:RHS repeat-associated protein